MEDLIHRIIDGETALFSEIIDEYNSTVRMFFASRIFDQQSIDDLAQEVFIAVYENLSKYDIDRNLKAWIMGIAFNRLKLHYRKNKNRQTAYDKLLAKINKQEFQPDIAEISNDKTDQLRDCMKKLPEKAMNILKARFYEKEKVKDLALLNDMTIDALSAFIYRSKKKLAECIEGNLA